MYLVPCASSAPKGYVPFTWSSILLSLFQLLGLFFSLADLAGFFLAKRFWLVLLSLGLIVAFSTSAMAVDVKVSGEYYAAGMYLDRTTLHDGYTVGESDQASGPSTAFYFQRLRVRTDFIVSPGLTFISRFDAMERAWGANRSSPNNVYDTLDYSAGTRAENENIAFDLAYVMYVSPIGVFLAGYQIDGAWGTVFGDDSIPVGKIGYNEKMGSLALGIQTGKNNGGELSRTAINSATAADKNSNFYTAWGRYGWKGGEAGLLVKYIRNASNRGAYAPFMDWIQVLKWILLFSFHTSRLSWAP